MTIARRVALTATLVFVMVLRAAPADDAKAGPWAEIRVVDAETGRGVPLVELETVNRLLFVTDSAGRVAFQEPGLMGREVYFTVRSHGYDAKKDGFGFAGAKVTPRAGAVAEIKVTRRNVAERLCRLTGEGRFRDSELLGHKVPAESPNPGRVAGQDSVQAVVYKGSVLWFWGDTQRMGYPLGLFRTAGAKTAVPPPAFDPAAGLPFDYFTDKTGFARAMIPIPERPEGVVWIDGVCVVPDRGGAERLVAHYTRRKGLAAELEHGVAVFDDAKAVFEPVKQLPVDETWRHPRGHPIIHEDGGKRWLLSGNPVPTVRVPATFEDVIDPAKYEAFTCAKSARGGKPDEPEVADGATVWRWRADLPPVESPTEFRWVKAGKVAAKHARLCPADAANPADRVQLHNGTVHWNEHRKRWVLVAGQSGGKTSNLGEVWYAEAAHPTGPFETAVKVVTHDRMSFYNVCHHPFLDRDGGRVIHFEGTYTADFSGNPHRTPRYEYNQILYRLDLDAAALRAARSE